MATISGFLYMTFFLNKCFHRYFYKRKVKKHLFDYILFDFDRIQSFQFFSSSEKQNGD